ncbi:MAG: amidohydrolase family protein [Chloroflexi bacterium]|nr:amidohydrolase family protein [Chloroflexota bacterium]
MIIDIHAHVIPRELLCEAAPDEAWRPRIYRGVNGRQMIELGGRAIDAALREFVDVERILAEQDAAGVDLVVLSPFTSLLNYQMDAAEAQRTSRLQNESIARLAHEYPERIAGMGTVPLQDASVAAREAEYIVNNLQMGAIEVGTNVNGAYLGDEKFLPFWEAVAALDVLVFIHPIAGIGGPLMRNYYLGNLYGNPAETGATAADIILSGLLERFPTLKILLAHGGGVLPAIIGRMDHGYAMRAEPRAKIPQTPSTYFKRLHFDTLTHSAELLQHLIGVVGADHILLGSDYPFDMGTEQPREIVEGLDLTREKRDAILGGNASKLLRMDARG